MVHVPFMFAKKKKVSIYVYFVQGERVYIIFLAIDVVILVIKCWTVL